MSKQKSKFFFKIHYFHVLTSPLKHLLGGLATPAAWRFSGWQLNKKYTGYISILKYVECRYMYWPTRCAWLICFSFFGLDVVELDFWLCQSYEFSHVRVSIHIVSQIFIGFTRFYLLAWRLYGDKLANASYFEIRYNLRTARAWNLDDLWLYRILYHSELCWALTPHLGE